MKFICSQQDLTEQLSLLIKAVPSRPSHPVLGNIYVSCDNESQQVIMIAFDLSFGIKTKFSAQVDTDGEITIPAKLLADIVAKLEGLLDISINDKDENVVNILSANGVYSIRGMSIEEYPDLPEISEGEELVIPASELAKGLRGTTFAASPDETKQVLTGVNIIVDEKGIEFATTDGHRLAVVSCELETEQRVQMTIPARVMREVERLLQSFKGDDVSLLFDQDEIIITIDNHQLFSRRLNGQFPIYRQLIPNKFTSSVIVDRKRLLAGVDRVGIFASQRNNIIKCSLKDDKVQLSIDAKEVGDGEESLPAQFDGQEMDIAFNVKYLTDGLRTISATEVKLNMNTPESPVVMAPLSGENMQYLIMPVQLRN